MLYYKGRVDLGGLDVVDVGDCKDRDLHVSVKHAFRLRCGTEGESLLLCARKPEQKQRWLQAFAREREQVRLDQETGAHWQPHPPRAWPQRRAGWRAQPVARTACPAAPGPQGL